MAEKKTLHAIYMIHRRGEHDYREWVIMPQTETAPVQVWSRYIQHEGARPVWRGTRRGPSADHARVREHSEMNLNTFISTVNGHYRQNERGAGRRQWAWDAPIVVETTEDECREFCFKAPYPVLNRIKRVQQKRKETPDVEATLSKIAEILSRASLS
jgi:hypothetical protein